MNYKEKLLEILETPEKNIFSMTIATEGLDKDPSTVWGLSVQPLFKGDPLSLFFRMPSDSSLERDCIAKSDITEIGGLDEAGSKLKTYLPKDGKIVVFGSAARTWLWPWLKAIREVSLPWKSIDFVCLDIKDLYQLVEAQGYLDTDQPLWEVIPKNSLSSKIGLNQMAADLALRVVTVGKQPVIKAQTGAAICCALFKTAYPD